MFFRNLTCFKLPEAASQAFHALANDGGLQQLLGENQLRPIGPLELYCNGFVSPLGGGSEALHHTIGSCTWITLGSETKRLPASAVAKALEEKVAEIEKNSGRRPGGRQRKQIKEDVIAQILPRLIPQPNRVDAYFDSKRHLLVVDASSRKAAESVCSALRHAIGTFPALPLNSELAPRAVLTQWVGGEPLPEELSLGDEVELKEGDRGAIARCQRQDLTGDEVAKHLESGKQATRLGLYFGDRISLVFGEDLVIRKFKLLDAATDQLDSIDREDLKAELDARFVLLSGETGTLFDTLSKSFKFSEAA